jgi:hypothetical protein
MDGNLPRGAHTDKSNGRPIFKDLDWFVYKVSGVMYSTSVCEHYWSIEGWIHSKRRNRLSQELVERLLRAHTNLVFRQSFDVTLDHLLPWDTEFVMDDPGQEPEVYVHPYLTRCVTSYCWVR